MVDIKPILRAGTSLQALALLKENIKLAKKKKAKSEDFLQGGAKNIVGVSLLKAQSDFIEDF